MGAKFKSGRDFFRVLITIIGSQDSLVQQWALEPTLPSVQWVPRAVSPELSSWGVKTDLSTHLVPML
jgi:hypothetical protein